ncbi:scavenger receptor cysteine-rich domain-containing group B protein-like [Mixophyes fleayi]|uniref:scavenger receptor cysteine-rich domain-containing group B protein-like n=1 Tax=Mixophyes fleayi TaxID=3061075 RepID=UPI003F4D7C7E
MFRSGRREELRRMWCRSISATMGCLTDAAPACQRKAIRVACLSPACQGLEYTILAYAPGWSVGLPNFRTEAAGLCSQLHPSTMSVLILLLMALPCAAAGGCSSAVHTNSHITIFNDRFEYMGNLPEFEELRKFVENLQPSNHTINLHLHCYDPGKLSKYIRDNQAMGTVSYTVQRSHIVEFINSMTWKPSVTTARTSHILILMLDGYDPYIFMKPKIQKMKRAGLEIFVMGFKKIKHHDLDDVASYPAETHSFNWRQYPNGRAALSELAQSVCRSLEAKERNAKKTLLSQVRLVGGRDLCQGRVEVLYNNTWGWLSDEHLDRHVADVICRQLNCGPSVEALKGDAFGPAPGHVLEKVLCTGDEHEISQCLLGQWDEQDHKEIQHSAGVTCLSSGLTSVRLVNGSGTCDGIVEISLNNTWNRICLWNFDLREAAVVCRQLGCGPLLKIQENIMGDGSEVQMVEKTHCSGAESQLSECSISLWSKEPCFHNVHAGLVCSPSALSKVTVTGGIGPCAGRVKVYHNNKLSAVCADHWTVAEEAVLCKQIGCGPTIELAEVRKVAIPRGAFPQADVRSVHCGGSEATLSHCGSVVSKGSSCDAWEAEVLCSQSVISQVRLVDGGKPCSGRVEIFYKEQWGTVCDETWDLSDANVVCRQVGCGPAMRAPVGAYFGPGSGHIWLEKIYCHGSESALSACGAVISRKTLCVHSQDAGVVCEEKKVF